VVESLYQILDPESDANPFRRSHTRWRVFIAFVLMLHQGLRRGELLLLTADAIKSSHDRKFDRTRDWLNVRQNGYEEADGDSRYSKPSIKTIHSIRQIPVSDATARLVPVYCENCRGRPSHSFMLNAQTGGPLSTESLTKIFTLISKALPSEIRQELHDRTGKRTVTCHDLPHYVLFLTMSGEMGVTSCWSKDWALRSGTAELITRHSFMILQTERWLREFGQFVEWKSWGVDRP
jgi:integrase